MPIEQDNSICRKGAEDPSNKHEDALVKELEAEVSEYADLEKRVGKGKDKQDSSKIFFGGVANEVSEIRGYENKGEKSKLIEYYEEILRSNANSFLENNDYNGLREYLIGFKENVRKTYEKVEESEKSKTKTERIGFLERYFGKKK